MASNIIPTNDGPIAKRTSLSSSSGSSVSQLPIAVRHEHSSEDEPGGAKQQVDSLTSAPNSSPLISRPKRIACMVCRKRKLRCGGEKPNCGTCARLGHECGYDEVRRKSGPKRGYVKALEARLAQVETLLRSVGNLSSNSHGREMQRAQASYSGGDMSLSSGSGRQDLSMSPDQQHRSYEGSPTIDVPQWSPASHRTMSWELLSLGFDEALPSAVIVDKLHKLYFAHIHQGIPIIHKGRYYASFDLPPSQRPPVALRYAIWAIASSVSEEYSNLQSHFYNLARKYLEDAELKGVGEGVIAISFVQAWLLVTVYEFKLMYFPRAWMSTGRSVRLAQMMSLHRLDSDGLEVKHTIPPPKDWIEWEERRRIFWMCFCLDRYASIGTGWPMTIDEKDVLTDLPAPEDAFDDGRPKRSLTLKESMTATGAAQLSPFGGVCLMASLFGRNLVHLHRPDLDEEDGDTNGEFWKRHRQMDNVLVNIQTQLPPNFRLPVGSEDPNVVFTHLNIHTSIICLHLAAIFKAEKNKMGSNLVEDSMVRCITAAVEITSIMRMDKVHSLHQMNPFFSFCVFIASRVFIQYLKSHPEDEQVTISLKFLIGSLGQMKKRNPLAESFLAQLDLDLNGTLDTPENIRKFQHTRKKGQSDIPPSGIKNDVCSLYRDPSQEPVFLPIVACNGYEHSPLDRHLPISVETFPGLPPQHGRSPPSLGSSEFPHHSLTTPPNSVQTPAHKISAQLPLHPQPPPHTGSMYLPPVDYFSEYNSNLAVHNNIQYQILKQFDGLDWDVTTAAYNGEGMNSVRLSSVGSGEHPHFNGMGVKPQDMNEFYPDNLS